ncbi:hypothetical protein FN846DRAFT_904640 [Sphaerosporella brunnea]|uniref:Uncharacterized protein n=1 Tax=Sphaerosporella brunnea TaxID=1250544 RepID=A0A5J5F3S0_9PEZI|nr:hypothetical protein FN846DRAFT_904640 [Sphaerosporella brunnea]
MTESIWFCPVCGFGPLNPNTDPACPECGWYPGCTSRSNCEATSVEDDVAPIYPTISQSTSAAWAAKSFETLQLSATSLQLDSSECTYTSTKSNPFII